MKLARQARRTHKHFTSSYSLRCAPKIALFRSTGQLQRRNVTLSRWHKGAQLCHAAETNTMKATNRAARKEQVLQLFPCLALCGQNSAFPQYRATAVSKRSTVAVAEGCAAMSCRRNKHHEGDPTGLHGRNKYCICSLRSKHVEGTASTSRQ